MHSDLLSSLHDLVHSATSDRYLALLMVGGVKLSINIVRVCCTQTMTDFVGNYNNLAIPYQIIKFQNLEFWA